MVLRGRSAQLPTTCNHGYNLLSKLAEHPSICFQNKQACGITRGLSPTSAIQGNLPLTRFTWVSLWEALSVVS